MLCKQVCHLFVSFRFRLCATKICMQCFTISQNTIIFAVGPSFHIWNSNHPLHWSIALFCQGRLDASMKHISHYCAMFWGYTLTFRMLCWLAVSTLHSPLHVRFSSHMEVMNISNTEQCPDLNWLVSVCFMAILDADGKKSFFFPQSIIKAVNRLSKWHDRNMSLFCLG